MSDLQPPEHIATSPDVASPQTAANPFAATPFATQSGTTPFASAPTPVARLDLDQIEADLADVEIALARLDSGEYWNDEVTGQPLDDALLAERPTVRRAAQ